MTRSYLFIKACVLILAVDAANADHDTCAASPRGCGGKKEGDASTLMQSRVRISGGLAPDLNAEDPPDSDLGDAGADIDDMGVLETNGSEPGEHVPGEEIEPLELDEEQYSKIAQVRVPPKRHQVCPPGTYHPAWTPLGDTIYDRIHAPCKKCGGETRRRRGFSCTQCGRMKKPQDNNDNCQPQARCEDVSTHCPLWAKRGYCSISGYAKRNCRKACQKCEIPVTTNAASAECAKQCRDQGYCCNDYTRGSNQLFSCAQACMIRFTSTVTPQWLQQVDCNAFCLLQADERGCSREVNGHTYAFCNGCTDLKAGDSKCAHGVPGTAPCIAGCAMNVESDIQAR